jgi:hypothetical protein
VDGSNHFGPWRWRICHGPILAGSPTHRFCHGNGSCRSCSDISHDPSVVVWRSSCRPPSTATGDALVRCQSRWCCLVDCHTRNDASAAALASCPAGTLLWNSAWLLLSGIPVHYSTTCGQGRFAIRELPHRAELPVILFRGSNAGRKLCCLCRASSSFCLRWTHLHRFGAVPGYATLTSKALSYNYDFSASPTTRDTLSDVGDA